MSVVSLQWKWSVWFQSLLFKKKQTQKPIELEKYTLQCIDKNKLYTQPYLMFVHNLDLLK